MTAEDAQKMIDRAAVCVYRGESSDALVWLDRAREYGKEDGREQLLRGLALAHAGQPDQALESLRRATMLSPAEPRAFFNYACLLAKIGEIDLAKEVVGEALRIRPYYTAAMRLRENLESGRADVVFDLGEPHTIGWIAEAGRSWSAIGWTVAGLTLAMWLVRAAHPIAFLSSNLKAAPLSLGIDPLSIAIVFVNVVAILASFLWVVTDLVDRRGRVIWLVPMIVFTFWGGLVAIPHALYMWIGRK